MVFFMTRKFTIGNLQLAIRLDRRPRRGRKKILTGNSLSRLLRAVLERKWIKNIFGVNLAVAVLFTNVIGQPISAFSLKPLPEITAISPAIITLTTNQSARVPTQNTFINQRFSLFHRGIDFDGNIGEPVYPTMDGVVEKTTPSRFSYGNHLIIDHGGGFTSLYAHLSKILVQEGDWVDKNSVIGLVGNSGWTTGAHLHFEVLENGRQINPLTILPSR